MEARVTCKKYFCAINHVHLKGFIYFFCFCGIRFRAGPNRIELGAGIQKTPYTDYICTYEGALRQSKVEFNMMSDCIARTT